MLNWLHVDVDRLNPAGPGNLTPFGPAPGTPPLGVQIGQDLDIFGLRTQYAF
jgi:phosphate-selective porin OprO/OprP